MPNLVSETWRPLPATAPGVPPLLVSTIFSPESYNIRLTDLVRVWSEDMSRSQIAERARRERTSIDPGESGQVTKMIELLRAALVADDPLHDTTSIALSTSSTEGRGQKKHGLILKVTANLAEPFKPFHWPIRLQCAATSAIATQLVLPLAHTSRVRAWEIDKLVAVLADKDAVITRLLDKLDQVGLGPEHVFTSLASATSGRRGPVPQEVAEARVKGLAKFDAEAFRKKEAEAMAGDENRDRPKSRVNEEDDMSDANDDAFALLGLAFGESSLPEPRANRLYGSSRRGGVRPEDEWWTDLDMNQRLTTHPRRNEEKKDKYPSPAKPPPSSTPVVDDDETESEDDFQVQVTPAKPRSAQNQRSSEATRKTTESFTEVNGGVGNDGHVLQVQATPSKAKPLPAARTAARRNRQDSSDEDGFQTQETPAKIRAARGIRGRSKRKGVHDDEDGGGPDARSSRPGIISNRKRACAPDNDSTDGEDEEENGWSPSKSRSSKPATVVWDRIGGSKEAKQTSSSLPQPPPRAPALLPKRSPKQHDHHKDAEFRPETSSASEENNDSDLPESIGNPKSKSGGLGRIGGKAKKIQSPSRLLLRPRSPPEEETRTMGMPGPTRRGIGRIGGKGKASRPDKHVQKENEEEGDEDDDDDKTESPGSENIDSGSKKPGSAADPAMRRPSPVAAPTPALALITDQSASAPETDAERALRKRTELERELAKKKAAGPARKKRKF